MEKIDIISILIEIFNVIDDIVMHNKKKLIEEIEINFLDDEKLRRLLLLAVNDNIFFKVANTEGVSENDRRLKIEYLKKEFSELNSLSLKSSYIIDIIDEAITEFKRNSQPILTEWIDEYGVVYSFDKKILIQAKSNLKSYTINESCQEILDFAFSSIEVEEIIISENVSKIGIDALNNILKIITADSKYFKSVEGVLYTADLKTLVALTIDVKNKDCFHINESVESIYDGVFGFSFIRNYYANNMHFKSIDGVLYASDLKTLVAFPYSASVLNQINIGSDNLIVECIESIGDYACHCCGLKTFYVPDNVKYIGKYSFANNELVVIYLSRNLLTIDKFAFCNNDNLTVIHIPEGVSKIEDHAFSYCENLSYVYLPESIIYLGEDVFYRDEKLKKIFVPPGTSLKYNELTNYKYSQFITEYVENKVPDTLKKYTKDDETWKDSFGVLYSKNKEKLIALSSLDTKYYIDDNCLSICDNSHIFPNNSVFPSDYEIKDISTANYLIDKSINNSIVIPESMIYVSGFALNGFEYINANNPYYQSTNGVLFSSDWKTLVKFPYENKPIEKHELAMLMIGQDKSRFKTYFIPKGVTTIDDYAFSGSIIEEIYIPQSVYYIHETAFAGVYRLKRIEAVNNYFKSIDGVLFRYTTLVKYPRSKDLKEYYVPDEIESLSSFAFSECDSLVNLCFYFSKT